MVIKARKRSRAGSPRKYNNVGLSPQDDAQLTFVCDRRGWKKVEAVRRMLKRELQLIEAEDQAQQVTTGALPEIPTGRAGLPTGSAGQ
ncbi:MAG TPA: hypothetical protein VHM90_07065 [Phycisphaerae bacterium]|nr:hypothetical protein [Phycisphaerae bacterium]